MINNLYKSLYRIRTIEEKIALIYPTDQIKSPVHLSIGQEAIAAGVSENLYQKDFVDLKRYLFDGIEGLVINDTSKKIIKYKNGFLYLDKIGTA